MKEELAKQKRARKAEKLKRDYHHCIAMNPIKPGRWVTDEGKLIWLTTQNIDRGKA